MDLSVPPQHLAKIGDLHCYIHKLTAAVNTLCYSPLTVCEWNRPCRSSTRSSPRENWYVQWEKARMFSSRQVLGDISAPLLLLYFWKSPGMYLSMVNHLSSKRQCKRDTSRNLTAKSKWSAKAISINKRNAEKMQKNMNWLIFWNEFVSSTNWTKYMY